MSDDPDVARQKEDVTRERLSGVQSEAQETLEEAERLEENAPELPEIEEQESS